MKIAVSSETVSKNSGTVNLVWIPGRTKKLVEVRRPSIIATVF